MADFNSNEQQPEQPDQNSQDDSTPTSPPPEQANPNDQDISIPSSPPPEQASPTISPTINIDPTPVVPQNQDFVVSQQKKSKKWLWIVVILIIIIAIVVGGYLLNRKHNSNTVSGKQDIPLIRYGYDNNPLNVFYPSNESSQGTLAVQPQIFEGLVSFQNGTQIKPQLASSWSNPSNTTWIFNLKPNIYYHDGDKVTAQDVVDTWQQVSTSSDSSTYAAFLTNTIQSVKALNSSTVEITTSSPDPILLNRLAGLYIIDSKAPKGTPAWGLGTGAYTVKPGTTPSSNDLDLVAFDKWHGGHIYTKAIDYIFYADPEQAVKDLEAGKLNLVDSVALNDVTSQVKNTLNVFTTPQIGTNVVGFDTTNPSYPTSNIKIREAMALAISGKQVLADSQQNGIPLDQLVPQEIPGYNPDIKATVQNISEAASLVKAAGYPNGVTINLAVGEPVLSMAQAIAKEVKPAGITINIQEATDEGQYFDGVYAGDDQSFIEGSSSSLVDGSDLMSGLLSGVEYYNNPQVDTDLNNATTATTATEHIKDLQAASLAAFQDYAYVPLGQESDINISDKGMVFPLNDYDSDLNSYFANVYRQ